MLTAQMTCIDGLQRAYDIARQSLDTSTQNGAILVDQRRGVLISDCNHFPRGVARTPEREERTLKYRYTVHAEAGVIYGAASRGISTQDLVMVSPWAPCTECAKAIIFAGISEVVVHKELMALTPERWRSDIDFAIQMLREANVKYSPVTAVCGKKIRFDGKDIEI